MIKFNSIVIVFSIILSSLIFSCQNTSNKTEETEVDSAALMQSVDQANLNKILVTEKPDFILDSLYLIFTLDWQKVINKKILVKVNRLHDIYEDKDGIIHVVVISSVYDNYFDLVCTAEQSNIFRGLNGEIYLIVNPVSVKKIDFKYVSTLDSDIFEEGEKYRSQIDVDDSDEGFMIKGTLLNIIRSK